MIKIILKFNIKISKKIFKKKRKTLDFRALKIYFNKIFRVHLYKISTNE
jgi:hypothetical protein